MIKPLPDDSPPAEAAPHVPGAVTDAVTDPVTQRERFNPSHPMLFIASEGENRVDGLGINEDPLPLMGTDGARNLG